MGFVKWLRKGRPPLLVIKALLLLPAVWIFLIVLAILLPIRESTREGEICAICGSSRYSYSLHLGPLPLFKSSKVKLDKEESTYIVKELGYSHQHKWIWNFQNDSCLIYPGRWMVADGFASRRIPITYSGVLYGLKKIKDREKAIEIVKTMADQENKIRALVGAVLYDLWQTDTSKWTDADWKNWWKQNETYLQIVYDPDKATQLIDKAKENPRWLLYTEMAEAYLYEPR